MAATYHFHGDLVQLLHRRWRGPQPIVLAVTRRALDRVTGESP